MRALVVMIAAASTCLACVEASDGTSALLRVDDAHWVAQPMAPDRGGPAVTSVRNAVTTVAPGQRDKALTGTLAASATGVALMLEGDGGYWLFPAGAPDVFAPGELTFAARLALSPEAPIGDATLLVRAIDEAGRWGPIWREPLRVQARPPADGALVVSLQWDSNADLDLHVVDPNGVEIWSRNINSYEAPPPGVAEDPEGWRRGGILDFDSNANCVIDGRRRENVVWVQAPPAGVYVVRVEAASLCEQVAARWRLEVLRSDVVVAHATGTLVAANTLGKQGAGGGLLALTFIQP